MPTLEDRTIVAAAVSAGHHVLVPLGNGDASSRNTIELPRPHRDAIRASLLAMGITEDNVDPLATLGRRSFAALRRRLAVEPAVLTRRWAQANEAKALIPALLIGSWDDTSAGDREVVAQLAGTEYSSVSATLLRWANESDPPVRMVGSRWMLASREEAWQLLSPFVTHDDLQRFANVATEVLSRVDPAFDLPVSERPFANLRGKILAQSGYLREGVTETLALMAAFSDRCPLADIEPGQTWADRVVQRLLATQGDWRVWASVSWLLPLLAEASPRVFLDAIERAVEGDHPVLADLFTDHGEEFGTFNNSPHTGLLWALEVLSWSPDYLSEAALYLASLARIDPGGKLGNRPIGSLREIFLNWHPQTAAPLTCRLHAIGHMRRREPRSAWQLMTRLLPEIGSTGHPTSKPRWRDWSTGAPEEVTWGEFQQASAEIIARLLEDVGTDGQRWSDLIKHISNLAQDELEAVTQRLDRIDVSRFSSADRKVVWETLREVISRHVAFPDAKWAMTQERLSELRRSYARFEAGNSIERTAWLFAGNPAIMIAHGEDYQERQKLIDSERVKAVHAVHAEGGISALLELAAQSERPGDVGWAMGQCGILGEDEDFFLWQNLGSSQVPRRSLAFGYLASRVSYAGIEWLEQQASSKFAAYASPQQLADFYRHWPFTVRTWDRVDTLDEETRRLYWEQAIFWGLGEAADVDHERAVENFVKYGQLGAAIHFISLYAREEGPRVPLTTVSDVLHNATQGGAAADWSNLGYDVAKLLDLLDAWEGKDQSKLARIEWFLLPVLRHYGRPPRTLHRALATQPEFFCEVLKSIYRAKGEEPRVLGPEEEARAQLAYELLQGWHVLPGLQPDSGIDVAALKAWTARTRELAIESDREAIGDQEIGRMLSAAPKGTDDVWPHEAVRDVIDGLNNKEIDRGLVIGVYNGRGTTMRAIGEGGAQERTLTERYRGYARKVRDEWPRTARVLEQIADGFERDARREDLEAELEEDLWR